MIRNICVVTGTRAEYGLLYWLLTEISNDLGLQLQIIATGMHLSPEFGSTYTCIEADGFTIDARVEMLLSSDTPVGVAKSMGLGVIGIADAFERLKPDMVFVVGDRFEILAAAQAAMVLQIPLAHLGGGDNGMGTYDNIIRHCVTKMASLHFVTHELARNRVIQLGENPDRVFCFGATSVDNIVKTTLLSKAELERDLGIVLGEPSFLVTFHPLTMDVGTGVSQLEILLKVLGDYLSKKSGSVIFTKSNADNGGRAINQILQEFSARHKNCHLFDSLGQLRYLSLLKQVSVVIGNSSSGIYEAPYLQTPTVDIGSRQRGRAAPQSVIRSEVDETSLHEAIEKAMAFDFRNIDFIYGEGDTSRRIVAKMKEFIGSPGLAIKEFFDVPIKR